MWNQCAGCPGLERMMHRTLQTEVECRVHDHLFEVMGRVASGTKGLTFDAINHVSQVESDALRSSGDTASADLLMAHGSMRAFAAHACRMSIQQGRCGIHKPQQFKYEGEQINGEDF